MVTVTFTLLILKSPNTGETAHTAYAFAQAAIAAGHIVRQVFFYSDAALAAGHALLPGDEIDIVAAWRGFALAHGIEFVVCDTAAKRRGLGGSANEQADRGSLAQLLVAMDAGQRVVTFA